MASAGNVSEGAGTLTYTVTRTGASNLPATIQFSTAGGTASAGSDYTAVANQTLSFAAGETSKTVTVIVNNDGNAEANETVVAAISNASAGSITTAAASATILDDDQSIWSVASAGDVSEDAGFLTYTVTRTGAANATAIVQFSTAGGTATAGSDYAAIAAQTLSFAAGETSKTVMVAVIDDLNPEGNETVAVANYTVTVNANDGSNTTSEQFVLHSTATEGVSTYTVSSFHNGIEGAGATIGFGVTRGGNVNVASTSYFQTTTASSTATPGVDYVAIPGQTLLWAVGETFKSIEVNIVDDTVAEPYLDNVSGRSASDSGFTTGVTTVQEYILDNDFYIAAAGVADILVTGTVNGGYPGNTLINTGDMNDSVTLNLDPGYPTVIDLGTGDDTLVANALRSNFFVSYATGQYTGGSGVDTLSLTQTTAFNFNTTPSATNFIKGFEIVSMTATGNQTLNLNLDYALQFTTGNAVADTLRITGNAGDVLNLSQQGQTLVTVAPGTSLTDVDGAAYTVAASATGNASASDVTIGGRVYDVYQYQYTGHTVNLLVDTLLTTTVI